MTRPPKDFGYWKATVLRDWPSRLVLTILVGFAGLVWSQGKEAVTSKVMEIVKPSLDTITRKQESTDVKVDSVDAKVEKVDAKVDALISILVEAFPQVKKAAQERTQKNRDSQDVQDALTGDKP